MPCFIYSDQVSQYDSEQFRRLWADTGIACSMSPAGKVWDSSAMESFLSSLKTERTARKVFRTRDAGRAGDRTHGDAVRHLAPPRGEACAIPRSSPGRSHSLRLP